MRLHMACAGYGTYGPFATAAIRNRVTQACLDGEKQERPIPSSNPCSDVRRGDKASTLVLRIIADGAQLHMAADTPTGSITATTIKGAVKTWSTLDAAAKWVRSLRIGNAQIDMANWQPQQRGLRVWR
jgi:hypothetical protein